MALHEAGSSASNEYLHAAFETSERARARMTADLLREASVDLRAAFDVPAAAHDHLVVADNGAA